MDVSKLSLKQHTQDNYEQMFVLDSKLQPRAVPSFPLNFGAHPYAGVCSHQPYFKLSFPLSSFTLSCTFVLPNETNFLALKSEMRTPPSKSALPRKSSLRFSILEKTVSFLKQWC